MFSKPVNWTTNLFKTAAEDLSKASRLQPGRKELFMAAGVAAPFVFSNRDRDPVETAFATTPVIAAGFVAAPAIQQVFQRTKQSGAALLKQGYDLPRIFQKGDLNEFLRFKMSLPKEHWNIGLEDMESKIRHRFYTSGVKSKEQLAAELATKKERWMGNVQAYMKDLELMKAEGKTGQLALASATFKDAAIAVVTDPEELDRLRSTELPDADAAWNFMTGLKEKWAKDVESADPRFLKALSQRIKQEKRNFGVTVKDGKILRDAEGNVVKTKYAERAVVEQEGLEKATARATADSTEATLDLIRKTGRESLLQKVEAAQKRVPDLALSAQYEEETGKLLGINATYKGDVYNVGIVDVNSRSVLTGKDFRTHGVGRKAVVVGKDSMQKMEADELFFHLIGNSQYTQVERRDLLQNLTKFTSWHHGFGETDAKAASFGTMQRYLFGHSSALADGPVHWNTAKDEMDTAQNLGIKQREEIVSRRMTEFGEATASGEGSLNNWAMYEREVQDMEISNYLHKSTTTQRTVMKQMQPFAYDEALMPSVFTTEAKALSDAHGVPFFGVSMTAGGMAPGQSEFYGLMERIAAERGVSASSDDMRRRYYKFLQNKESAEDVVGYRRWAKDHFKQLDNRRAFNAWWKGEIRGAFDESAYTGAARDQFLRLKGETIDLFKKNVGTRYRLTKSESEIDVLAQGFFKKTASWLANTPVNLRIAAGIGSAGGEGQRIVRGDVYKNIWLGSDQEYRITNPTHQLKDLLAYEDGKLKTNWQDLLMPKGVELGTSADPSLSAVATKYNRNLLVHAGDNGDGSFNVTLRSVHNFGDADIKTDFMGNKGGNVSLAGKHFEEAVAQLNAFSEAAGADHVIAGNVTSLESLHYNTSDAQVKSEELLSMAQQVFHESGQVNADSKIMRELMHARTDTAAALEKEFGISAFGNVADIQGFQVSKETFIRKAMEKAPGANRLKAQMDYENQLKERLFGEGGLVGNVSRRIEELADSNPLALHKSQTLSAYAKWRKNTMETNTIIRTMNTERAARGEKMLTFRETEASLINYLHHYHAKSMATAWESSQHNKARAVPLTEDFERLLERKGMHGAIREFRARQVSTGSGAPEGAASVFQWLAKGEYDKTPEGAKVVDLDTFSALNQEEAVGTILDSKRADLQDAFFVKVPMQSDGKAALTTKFAAEAENVSFAYIPHVGYGSLGSGVNRYNSKIDEAWRGEYAKNFQKLVKSAANSSPDDAEKAAEHMKQFISSHAEWVGGKGGLFRPKVKDPHAVFGRPQHVASHTEGAFDVFVNRDMFEQLRKRAPKEQRDSAFADGIFAVFERQPDNDVNFVRVRYNPTYEKAIAAENQMLISDTMRMLHRGDYDFDPGYLHPVFEGENVLKAKHEIFNAGSHQWQAARQSAALRNMELNVALTESFLNRKLGSDKAGFLADALKKYDYGQQAKMLKGRLAGQYIGQYSNFVTRVQLGMAKHPGFELPEEVFGESGMFQLAEEATYLPRQIPIWLRKSKGSDAGLGDPLKHLRELEDAYEFSVKDGGDKFVNKLQGLASEFGDDTTIWNKDLADKYAGILSHEEGDSVNVLKELLGVQDYRERMKQMMFGNREEVEAVRLMQDSKNVRDLLTKAKKEGRVFKPGEFWGMVSKVQSGQRMMSSHFAAAGMSAEADTVSSMLNAINTVAKVAAKEGRAAAKPAGRVALAGAIAAGAAGAFLTGGPDSMKAVAPPPPSARPEQSLGVQDQIPGAPETGYMSDNPQRNVSFRPGGVNKAVVAPMRRGTRVDVEMDSPDESRGKTLARRIGSVMSGDAFITNNYVGGWRDGATRASSRERIREDLDRY